MGFQYLCHFSPGPACKLVWVSLHVLFSLRHISCWPYKKLPVIWAFCELQAHRFVLYPSLFWIAWAVVVLPCIPHSFRALLLLYLPPYFHQPLLGSLAETACSLDKIYVHMTSCTKVSGTILRLTMPQPIIVSANLAWCLQLSRWLQRHHWCRLPAYYSPREYWDSDRTIAPTTTITGTQTTFTTVYSSTVTVTTTELVLDSKKKRAVQAAPGAAITARAEVLDPGLEKFERLVARQVASSTNEVSAQYSAVLSACSCRPGLNAGTNYVTAAAPTRVSLFFRPWAL